MSRHTTYLPVAMYSRVLPGIWPIYKTDTISVICR